MPAAPQPIVILGGFLITEEAYQPMVDTLARLSGQQVELVPVGRLEWLLTVRAFAWARILDRVAAAVARQAQLSPTGRVTLVGHSSGGVMLRLFLDDQPFEGRRWNGRALADTLVILGSPHTALKATPLRQLVARRLPGCAFPAVRDVSVAGVVDLDAARGEASATARRMAPTAYRNSSGDADDRGDGLVPVGSALLEGSQALVLEGVAHGGAYGPRWYGTPSVVERWWAAVAEVPAVSQSPRSAPM
ncbi:MAG: esterase/lipase family protein [Cyanobium sp.]